MWLARPLDGRDKKARRKAGLFLIVYNPTTCRLLDNLHDPVCARIDENSAVVHYRVAVIVHTIFRRHLVIGDAGI